jgi:hypothetical protein
LRRGTCPGQLCINFIFRILKSRCRFLEGVRIGGGTEICGVLFRGTLGYDCVTSYRKGEIFSCVRVMRSLAAAELTYSTYLILPPTERRVNRPHAYS